MLKEIRNRVFYGTIYCGLEHTTIKDQNMINVLLLKNQKQNLHIDKEISVHKIEEIKNHIDDKQHAHLIINDLNFEYGTLFFLYFYVLIPCNGFKCKTKGGKARG